MQRNYDNSLDSGALLVGQVYDTGLAQIDGYFAEEDIGFGYFVQYGTASTSGNAFLVKTLDSGGKFIGVAVRDQVQPVGATLATNGSVITDPTSAMTTITTGFETFPKGSAVSVMKLGRVAISIAAASSSSNAVIGSTVVWEPTGGGFGNMTFTTTPTPETSGKFNIGTVLTTPTAGKLVVVQINKL